MILKVAVFAAVVMAMLLACVANCREPVSCVIRCLSCTRLKLMVLLSLSVDVVNAFFLIGLKSAFPQKT